MTPHVKTRIKIWVVVVLVFVLGCITGISLDRLYRLNARSTDRQSGQGRRGTDDVLNKMKSELSLNDQQTADIRVILDQTGNEYRTLRTEVRPRYDAIRQNARTRIRSLLNAEQQKLFDAKAAERDARRGGNDKDQR